MFLVYDKWCLTSLIYIFCLYLKELFFVVCVLFCSWIRFFCALFVIAIFHVVYYALKEI